MPEDFRDYLREHFGKKIKNRIRLVSSEDQADAILTATTEDKSGVGSKTGVRDSVSATATLLDANNKGLIWSGEAGDRNLLLGVFAKRGLSKVAERLVDQLKNAIEDADKGR
jgi:hypothetical protein